MGKIVKLDERLSNKIAAGEVVERPASIVKELVENSIDANSTSITIEIEEGGLGSIRIIDNGDGIEGEDCLVAFDRHATSKITTDKDLFRIKTLGFRGEALPSIASVSHLQLKTCNNSGPGTIVVIEGGKILEHGAAASRKGTDITITNLFYNTPARLKYLKTVHTELGHITDYVYRLALAFPGIAFRLDHNGKKVFASSGNGDLKQVIASIYGVSVAKQMLPFEGASLDFHISGYVCKPEITRASRGYISIFINKRYIRNYPLTRAIQEGYHTLLPIGRYPIVVLHVEMDPILIDVNVHPAKLEVRLSKEDELTKLVAETVKSIFRETQLIPEMKKPAIEKARSEQISFSLEHSSTKVGAEEKQKPFVKEDYEPFSHPGNIDEEALAETNKLSDSDQQTTETREAMISPATAALVQDTTETKAATFDRVPVLYPIGQMHGTYILAQNDKGLYIVDQHAAQERINYEYFREKVGEVRKELQELIVPITFECSQVESERIVANESSLQELGIFIEPFGQQSFICRAHPTWFPKGLEEEIIRQMIETVISGKKITIKAFREEAAILMSCKAAIKANRHLRNDEIFSLLETLRKCEDPFTCPHGRPIFIQFSTYEMERMFKRIM